MTDEIKRDTTLNEEQLEQSAGGAGTGDSYVPCRWNQYGRPTHWIDLAAQQRFHYRCGVCGALVHDTGNGFMRCPRCGNFFLQKSARKYYGYFPDL